MLAVFDGGEDQVFRHLGTADQLHDDIDIGPADQGERVIGYFDIPAHQLARPFDVFVGNRLDQDAPAGPAADFLLVAAQDRERAAPDCPDTQQADMNGFHENSFRNEKAVMKNPSRK